MNPEPGSVSQLLEQLRADDPAAAEELWERFAQRMLELARRRLRQSPKRVADEEDVVVRAFERFLHGVRGGRFPRLNDRKDLWAVLFTLTSRVACRQATDAVRPKHGGGKVRGDSALIDLPHTGPGPDEEVLLQDSLEQLLAALGDDELRRIALARLEGRTVPEIAELIGRCPMTVQRRLELIRKTWKHLGLEENP